MPTVVPVIQQTVAPVFRLTGIGAVAGLRADRLGFASWTGCV